MIFLGLTALCFLNMEAAYSQQVMLDYFFNREVKKGADGQNVRYHYTWEDTSPSGFSRWGKVFSDMGGHLDSLPHAPTAENLKRAAIYIIVDPDSKKESANPNYMTEAYARVISDWVKNGGVLVLMANDSANTALDSFNLLAAKFGLHFNNDLENYVRDDAHFTDGEVRFTNDPIFRTTGSAFLKDVCSIGMSGNAKPAITTKNGKTIAATVTYGSGIVFAVGDPWLYNEYVNGRLPKIFENDKAMLDLSSWLLEKAKTKK